MIKKSIGAFLLPLASVFLVFAALAVNAGTGTVQNTAAAQASSPQVPNGPWIGPINVSRSSLYDNTASIAAAADGSVTIAWEQRDPTGGTSNFVRQASNTVLGGPFITQLVKGTDPERTSGNVKTANDSLGRRHIVFWAFDGTTCGYYARIEANGAMGLVETVPNTCGTNRKNTAIAVGVDNVVHALFGANNSNIYYYQRNELGWAVPGENVPSTNPPGDLSIGVTTGNVVIAAWKQAGPESNDIFTATRIAPYNWVVEDVTQPCCLSCEGDSAAYLPSLERDNVGGMRLAWTDERCDPRSDPNLNDIYYREWVPVTGWNNQPLVRVVVNSGHSYLPEMTVDDEGVAHILWQDSTSRTFGNYRIFYSYGRGTSFAPVELPVDAWGGSSYQKEVSLDASIGYIHGTFSSNRDDSQKENYYIYRQVTNPTPTATPPPTATPTLVPPRCDDRFKDVCPGDFHYTATLALADAGIVSGYNTSPPCTNSLWIPCFKPENSLTRGQASKIIALAAGFTGTPQGQSFQDVPTNSTFYVYIEQMASRGIIGGYACGGLNEPCVPPANRPYFRPNSNVTRGQLSKMVAEAFDFNEAITGQSFQDVPTNSTFYVYVERMARRGIIGGYACGGATEPCIPPTNRPYFRPNANVTRGQTTKIVYGAMSQSGATATPSTTPEMTVTPVVTVIPTVELTATPEATATSILPTVTVTIVRPSRP